MNARILGGVLAVVAAGLLLLWRALPPSGRPAPTPSIEGPSGTSAAPAAPAGPRSSLPSGGAGPSTFGPGFAPPPEPGAPELYPLDLTKLRAEMPGSRYWTLGAPTSDPAVLAARDEVARKKNEILGRIQAGDAGEEEIHAWFEEQRRLHQDFLDFTTRVLSEYGDRLPERDRGLYELGGRMHRDRLAELPRREEEAVARRREQDRRRREWEARGKK